MEAVEQRAVVLRAELGEAVRSLRARPGGPRWRAWSAPRRRSLRPWRRTPRGRRRGPARRSARSRSRPRSRRSRRPGRPRISGRPPALPDGRSSRDAPRSTRPATASASRRSTSASSAPAASARLEVLAPAGRDVVEHGHLVAPLEQGVHEVRADEAGAAGDQSTHEIEDGRRFRARDRRTVRIRLASCRRTRRGARHARPAGCRGQARGDLSRVPARAAGGGEARLGCRGGGRSTRPCRTEPLDPRRVLDELVADADPGITAMGSPRYFGFVIGGALPAAIAADWMVTAWDQNGGPRQPDAGRGRDRGDHRRLAARRCWGCRRTRRSRSSPAARWRT